MQLNAVVNESVGGTATVVRGVTPDLLEAPTPCADWDVRALTNHLLQVVGALRLAGLGQPVPEDMWTHDLMSGGDWADRFDEQGRAARAAWSTPSAWPDTVTMGQSPMPAPMIATMLAGDLVIHGWDLARATRQPFRCDAATAEVTRQFLTETGEQGRAMGIYAAAVPVDASASALDQALALSGRDPRWTPA